MTYKYNIYITSYIYICLCIYLFSFSCRTVCRQMACDMFIIFQQLEEPKSKENFELKATYVQFTVGLNYMHLAPGILQGLDGGDLTIRHAGN